MFHGRGVIKVGLVVPLACCEAVFAQTGNGYVGVFGDAAGTIRCMQAPPGVPTTLYVVAKTAGLTGNGITGAEFRIEVQNPSGYFLSYAAPNGSLVLGDPLSSTGFNISFSSCRIPDAGVVSLGTIAVFNTGSGGVSDIIVKRRNPPTNQNYLCALLVQCDAPLYTKSCNTAPPESVYCLTQKTRSGPTVLADEYSTQLDGSLAAQNYRYLGYTLGTGSINCKGFEGAEADIFTWVHGMRPAGGGHAGAWVGLQNKSGPRALEDATARWIQSGFIKQNAVNPSQTYVEWCGHSTAIVDGHPNGWSGVREQYDFPGGVDTHCEVIKDGLLGKAIVGPIEISEVPWAELVEEGNLAQAAWTGEVANDAMDRMPGVDATDEFGRNLRCKFKKVKYLRDDSSTPQTPSILYDATRETAHGEKTAPESETDGTRSFYIWRTE